MVSTTSCAVISRFGRAASSASASVSLHRNDCANGGGVNRAWSCKLDPQAPRTAPCCGRTDVNSSALCVQAAAGSQVLARRVSASQRHEGSACRIRAAADRPRRPVPALAAFGQASSRLSNPTAAPPRRCNPPVARSAADADCLMVGVSTHRAVAAPDQFVAAPDGAKIDASDACAPAASVGLGADAARGPFCRRGARRGDGVSRAAATTEHRRY
eukprot:SAG31_NODE_511_length_14722_cov_14.770499_1_plen_215_part_00